jgi:Rod binding domain-containing protein
MNFAMAEATGAGVGAGAMEGAAGSLEHRRLADAAQQFEGMLLQEMLKPMKEHGFCEGDEEEDSNTQDGANGLGDTLSSYGTEAMATAIAKAGGMGIAKRVVEQVESEKTAHTRGQGNGNGAWIPK